SSNVELRKTTLSKATLSSITKTIEGIGHSTPSVVDRQRPTLDSALSSLLLYEKEEPLELYHLLLSPVYRNTLERLDVVKGGNVCAVHVAFFYDEVDAAVPPHSSLFTIRGMPLRDVEFQQEMHTWLRLSYQPHTIAIQLPPLFAQVRVAEILITITPNYLMERPFLPTTSAFFFHKGMERLQLVAVTQQSAIELGLLLPIWHCQSAPNEPYWASLLRFLASTTSCAILSCDNPKVGLKEFYVLLSARGNTAIGLLCRYASFEQFLPPASEDPPASTTENLKFDLLLHELRNDRYSPIESGSGFTDQMHSKINAL
ncbi:hypothetical protein WA556_002432, partial [Blastocystis sp. ATCC 50177/Nand II]